VRPNPKGGGGRGRGNVGGQSPRTLVPTSSSGQPTTPTNVVVPKWRDAVPAPHVLPTVLHRCDDFVVINKPYGWASSPTAALRQGSISSPPIASKWFADTVLTNPDSSSLEDDAGFEGVPCLDSDCSGAMCFATSLRGQVCPLPFTHSFMRCLHQIALVYIIYIHRYLLALECIRRLPWNCIPANCGIL